VLGITDVHTLTTRLSVQRDFALTRYYFGKRDQDNSAAWNPSQRALLDQLNASETGPIISWDEREHGVEKWPLETDDAIDGNPGPWPDIAQWIAPVRSRRDTAQSLVNDYRANLSYPGFFNTDADTIALDRQPDPGPGDPNLGDPFGTWAGYFEWDNATIVETDQRWAITLFATGLSATSIDNAPAAEYTTDLIPRKTQRFNPAPGDVVGWSSTDLASNTLLQTGTAIAQADGTVRVLGLRVPRDPNRIRLVLTRSCRQDFNADGFVDDADFVVFAAAYEAFTVPPADTRADFNSDGFVDDADFVVFAAAYEAFLCP
jgi:hypothetical protein